MVISYTELVDYMTCMVDLSPIFLCDRLQLTVVISSFFLP